MSAHNQFIRKARLRVGDLEEKGHEGIDLSALQFSFQIKQANLQNPQAGDFRIYNLATETAKTMKAHEYKRVVLEAGYQSGAYDTIFDGEIIQARLGRENAVDTYMDILAAVGYSAHQSAMNITVAAGSTALDLAKAAAKAMGLPLVSYLTKPAPAIARGQVAYGMARNTLSYAAATMDATWYYTGTAIELLPLDQPKPTVATVLNATTGMIGWPEQTQDGIKVRCLLNPLLGVGSPVQIQTSSILQAQPSTDIHYVAGNLPRLDPSELYRIEVIEHHGNTRGNDWYSEITCLSIDPANNRLTGLVQKGQFS